LTPLARSSSIGGWKRCDGLGEPLMFSNNKKRTGAFSNVTICLSAFLMAVWLSGRSNTLAQTEPGSASSAGSVVTNTPIASASGDELKRKAEAGDADAQWRLGNCYYSGTDCKQDYDEAATWYRKAAEQGIASAQTQMGHMYEDGRGVAQDYQEAIKWYRKAAQQGEALAEVTLADCYEKGRGVAKDYVEAYKYYTLAVAQDFPLAPTALDALARSMTREQIAEGQHRASEFIARRAKTEWDSQASHPKSPDASGGSAADDSVIFRTEEWKRGIAAEQAEDWREMLKAAQALEHKFPGHPTVWYDLGLAYVHLEKYDDAVAAYHRAVTLKPGYLEAWLGLGLAYVRLAKYDDAVTAFRQAITLKPDYAAAWAILGDTYGQQGKRKEALDALDHLRKLDSSWADKLSDSLSRK
jgi:TPR repeat protein